jgi:hypothetical protein
MLNKLLSTLIAILVAVATLLTGSISSSVTSQALVLSYADSNSQVKYYNSSPYNNSGFQYFSTNGMNNYNNQYTSYQDLCRTMYSQYTCNQNNGGYSSGNTGSAIRFVDVNNKNYNYGNQNSSSMNYGYNYGSNGNYNYYGGNNSTYCSESYTQKRGAVSTLDGRNFKLEISVNSNNLPYGKMWVYAQPKVGGNPAYAQMTEAGYANNQNSNNCVNQNKNFTFNMSADKFAGGEYTVDFCSASCNGGYSNYKLGSVTVNIPRYYNNQPNTNPTRNYTNPNNSGKYTGTRYLNYVCGNMNNIYILSTPNGQCSNSQQRDAEMVRAMTLYQNKYRFSTLGGSDMMNKLVADRIITKGNSYWMINFTQLYAVVENGDYTVQTY